MKRDIRPLHSFSDKTRATVARMIRIPNATPPRRDGWLS